MLDTKNIIYDCLTPEEIELAKKPNTPEMEECLQFNDSIPRGKAAGFFHIWAHRFLARSDRWIYVRHNIWHLAKAVSLETTNLWSAYRFLHLFLIVTKMKPSLIVEFGSGVSTIILAETLKLIHKKFGVKGKVVSFEQSEQFFQQFNSKFPETLKEYAELHLKPVRLKRFGSYTGIFYDIDEYPKEIDLVYIDGATRTRGCPECNFVYRRVNADIVRMKNSGTKIRKAITDHRYTNFPFYVIELSSEYHVKLSKLWRSILIDPK